MGVYFLLGSAEHHEVPSVPWLTLALRSPGLTGQGRRDERGIDGALVC